MSEEEVQLSEAAIQLSETESQVSEGATQISDKQNQITKHPIQTTAYLIQLFETTAREDLLLKCYRYISLFPYFSINTLIFFYEQLYLLLHRPL